MRTSKRISNSFRTDDERVRTKVWTRSRTSSVNAFTAFTFAECICFCLAFLCFGVFYCSHETKRHFGFTMLFGNPDIGLERTDCYVDLDLRRNRKRISFTDIDKTLSSRCVRNAFRCSHVSELHCSNAYLILDSTGTSCRWMFQQFFYHAVRSFFCCKVQRGITFLIWNKNKFKKWR